MTLIIALAFRDGVVMASDSATTDVDSGTKQTTDKIYQLGSEKILYSGSGDVGLLQQVQEGLKRYSPKETIWKMRKGIRKLVVPELKEAYELHARYPQPPYHVPPSLVLLFAGILRGAPWILEVEKDGRATFYGEQLGYFAAIGSGKPWAQALFRPHLFTPLEERTTDWAKVVAHRVVHDSIQLAAGGLAEPVQLYALLSEKEPAKVEEPSELKGIEDACELWRRLEREALGKALAPRMETKKEPEIPKPEMPDEPHGAV